MSKKQVFIEYIAPIFEKDNIPIDALDYWKAFTMEKEVEKPLFTENGKLVLKFLKDNIQIETWKSKDIADALGISSRSVAGSARKLVSDGYLEKVGQDPIFYMLTEKGKEIIINED